MSNLPKRDREKAMIQPQTSLRFCTNQNAAKLQAKKDFQHYCVITGKGPEDRPVAPGYELDPAHVLPAGDFPEVKSCVQNIIPVIRYRHSWRLGFPEGDFGCLDLVDGTSLAPNRKPMDRLRWLVDNINDKFRPAVFERLRLVFLEGSKLYGSKIISRRDEALQILSKA
jgi:hypothetical protein